MAICPPLPATRHLRPQTTNKTPSLFFAAMNENDVDLLIEQLAVNNPFIKRISIECIRYPANNHYVFVTLSKDAGIPDLRYQINFGDAHVHECRLLGRAIGENSTLLSFDILCEIEAGVFIPPGTSHSLAALYDGVKQNVSMKSFSLNHLHVAPMSNFPMFDFGYFFTNNQNVESVGLAIGLDVTPDQGRAIAAAIQEVPFKKVNFCSVNDRCFEQIIAACSRAQSLEVSCNNNLQCQAVSALLQDHTAVMDKLIVEELSLSP
eukprot:scaffold8818_cov73-Cyclotella_meneghiniana.AAC.11